VFAVLRHRGRAGVLVLVNMSARAVSAACEVRGGWRMTDAHPRGPVQVPLDPYGLALLDVWR
jgi:hypothetical protein